MHHIFISYRRDDTKFVCDRIYDALTAVFGTNSVFRDIDGIPAGTDFRGAIMREMNQCRVALVLIGPKWLTLTDESGQRRLNNPDDFVRIEIETAISRGILVIPVLVQDGTIPQVSDLPQSLKQLVFQQARQVRADPDYKHDMDRIIADIAQFVPRLMPTPPNISLPPNFGKGSARVISIIGIFWFVLVLAFVGAFGFGAYKVYQNFTLNGSLFNPGSATNGAHTTLTAFCTAMYNSDYHTAYTYLSSSLQKQVGSESALPTQLIKGPFGATEKVTNCNPFVQSGPDGFYHESGNTANDTVEFAAEGGDGGSSTFGNQTMFFVKVNGAWKIDRIQGA